MTKEQLKTLTESLPDTFDTEMLIEKIIFVAKIEEARESMRQGNFFTEAQVIEKMKSHGASLE